MENVLKVKRIHKDAKLPSRATEGSAGADLFALIPSPIEIKPSEIVKIPTGISIELPSQSFVALVYARSGLAIKHGVTLANCVGVIDSDYRGEIIVGLCNISNEPYTIEPYERIAQLVITPVFAMPICEVEDLSDTQRGSRGFGSTGKK
jgi:dUTP pyrophosphatase